MEHLAPKNTSIDSIIRSLQVQKDIDHTGTSLHDLVQTEYLVECRAMWSKSALVVGQLVHERIECLQEEPFVEAATDAGDL